MHADPLPISDEPGGLLHAHDGRQAVLPCDHCAMGHQAPDLRHQPRADPDLVDQPVPSSGLRRAQEFFSSHRYGVGIGEGRLRN